MPTIIGDPSRTDKPAIIAEGRGYYDTIEISSPRQFDPALVAELRAELKRRVWPEPVNTFGHRLIVNRPSPDAIMILDRHWDQRHSQRANGARFAKWANLSLFRVHIAFDFDERPNVPKDYVEHVIRNNIHLRYRRDDDQILDYEGTQYSIKAKDRKSRPYQNTKFYLAEFGDLDGECDKLHFELMLERKRSVQSAGINRPRDLLNVRPRELFAKYCTVRDHSQHLVKIVKRTVSTARPHPLYDPERRAWQTIPKNVSVFKGHFAKRFERLQEWECFVISPRLHFITPPNVKRDDNEEWGELRTLLQDPHTQRERLITRERLIVRERL